MKSLHVLALFILTGFAAFAQDCVPDSSFNTPGIRPTDLPDDTVGILFKQVVTLVVPLDSTYTDNGTTYHLHVDSARVIRIDSVPRNFQFVCNSPTRTWKGGQKGCALIWGTADSGQTGLYHIWVYVVTYFKIVGLTTEFNRLDSSKIYFEIRGGWPAGIAETSFRKQLKAYPNPARDQLTLDLSGLPKSNARFELFDLPGKLVYNEDIDASTMQFGALQIKLGDLQRGLYLASISGKGWEA